MSNNIKICFILSHLPQGGAERQTINLIKSLDKDKYEITLLLFFNKPIFYSEIYELPIKLIINKHFKNSNWIIQNLNGIFFLRRVLKNNNFDILHTLLFHNGFWVRLIAPRKYSKRIIYSIRNDLINSSGFFRFFEKIFIRDSIVTTNSIKSREQFIRLVGERFQNSIHTIYNGFDVERFKSERPLTIDKKIIVGTIGRQTYQKNQIQIIEVINELKSKYPLHFYLIGDKTSDKAKEIEDYIKINYLEEYITVMGAQPDVEKYYKKFNIFILSSHYEGCPNVLFEALLSKCLCIISQGANSDMFIKDGINGFVYDDSNKMLKEKLIYAIELIKTQKATDIIQSGYDYAISNFSLHQMVKSYEEIYNRIIKIA